VNHRWRLRKGIHYNAHLQRAWDLYGEQAFTFKMVCPCTPDEQYTAEQERFTIYDWDMLYNTSTQARRGGSRLGTKKSEAEKRKIGDANRGRPTWNKGGKNTWAHRAVAARVSRYDYVVVAQHLDGRVQRFSHTAQASRSLGVGRTSIKNILGGRAHRTRCGWTFQREVTV